MKVFVIVNVPQLLEFKVAAKAPNENGYFGLPIVYEVVKGPVGVIPVL